MIWTQIIWYVVTLIISIALTPKPKKPKAAALEDFEFPTAEEDRSIPVVFGEIDISGPNVVWYGDLNIKAIRKSSGFSKATVGYKYYIGFHIGLCHGPADSITKIWWEDKECWTGNLTASGSGSIDQKDLYGGTGRGGGVIGDFDVDMGESGQTANAYLTSRLVVSSTDYPVPAYRGIVSFIWKGGYIGNSEYVKPIKIRVKRIKKGWQNDICWYPAKAELSTGMNPAHIIYETLTNSFWGMGLSSDVINLTNFTAQADLLYDEGFGLNMIWNQSVTIEAFLQEVLDHIDGGLTFNLTTGQYELTVFRANYVLGDLPIIDSTDIVEMVKFEKQGWGETVNEIILNYTDPTTRRGTNITAQDLSQIDAQGSRLSQQVDLPGITDHTIAHQVLARELAQRTTPLTRVTFKVNRNAWLLGFGSLFKLDRPERQCYERVFRVIKIDRGSLQDNTITIEAIEDIYQNEFGAGLAVQPSSVLEESPPPTPTASDVLSATTTTPPGSPADGDTYFIPAGATGAWSTHPFSFATWDADTGSWEYTPAEDGDGFYVVDTGTNYQFIVDSSGGSLGPIAGVTDHGMLTGLADDDHPQYQLVSTISEVIDDRVAALLVEGTNITITYDDGANTLTIDAAGFSSPLTTKGDLLVYSTAEARLPVGANGYVLTADSAETAGVKWAAPTGGGSGQSNYYQAGADPGRRYTFYDDFVENPPSLGWATNTSAGSLDYTTGVDVGHPGVAMLSSTTSTTGQAGLMLANSVTGGAANYMKFGGGVIVMRGLIYLPALMDGTTNTGQVRFGLVDELSGAPANGVHAQYDGNFANWRLYSRGGSGGTVNSSSGSIAVTAAQWTLLEIVIYDTSNAELYVDGVLAATLNTPFTTTGCALGFSVQKTAGTTAQDLYVDWVQAWQEFSTERNVDGFYPPIWSGAGGAGGETGSTGASFGDGVNTASIVDAMIGYVTVPYGGTIDRAQIVADVACSFNVEVWKAAGALPTVANKISASAPITLSSQTYNADTTLTGWTTSVYSVQAQ